MPKGGLLGFWFIGEREIEKRENIRMGRGKVELKRIENKINRQVTFAKRRNGLLKKAYELSVLCDAEIALLIFSNRGKLYEFCSSPSGMNKTVEKYRKHSYATMDPNQSAKDLQEKYQDYLNLKSRVEILQHSQRHLLGEEIAEMEVNELEKLERQVDASLRQIRSTKLEESDATLTQSLWGASSSAEHSQQQQQQQQGMTSYQTNLPNLPNQEAGFFKPLQGNVAWQMRYSS
ncbi:hypothetical protein Bca101_064622 [Brassica carinata]